MVIQKTKRLARSPFTVQKGRLGEWMETYGARRPSRVDSPVEERVYLRGSGTLASVDGGCHFGHFFLFPFRLFFFYFFFFLSFFSVFTSPSPSGINISDRLDSTLSTSGSLVKSERASFVFFCPPRQRLLEKCFRRSNERPKTAAHAVAKDRTRS